jgi:hypothetical protein
MARGGRAAVAGRGRGRIVAPMITEHRRRLSVVCGGQGGEEVEEEDGREVRQVGSGHWKGRSRRIRWLDARSDDG